MRILWVKANKILPVSSGGDIRSFNLLRHLAVSDDIIFLSYYDGPLDEEYEQELKRCLPGSICVCTGKMQNSPFRRGIDYLIRFPEAIPYAVSRFESSRVRQPLSECLRRDTPDVVVCDFLDAAINFPDRLTVPSVLFQHNVESEIWRRHAETATGLKKRIFKAEFAKMQRYERAMVQKFRRIVAVSEHDRFLMSQWVDPSHIDVVPTGVDLAKFRPEENSSSSGRLVVFVGAMDWEPNVDGVQHFCASVWPTIKSKVVDARFRIVGRNPDRRVRNLAGPSVEVTGSVPSVVEHLREAAVVVVPLRIGGGTRLKIYEAMAAGKAVVSTRIGAEGLDVNDRKDIWLADEPNSMADAVVSLLLKDKLRSAMERAAATQAAQFDWSAVAGKFRNSLRKSVHQDSQVAQLTAAG